MGSDQHWNCFKSNIGKTSPRRGRPPKYMGFPIALGCHHLGLRWTEYTSTTMKDCHTTLQWNMSNTRWICAPWNWYSAQSLYKFVLSQLSMHFHIPSTEFIVHLLMPSVARTQGHIQINSLPVQILTLLPTPSWSGTATENQSLLSVPGYYDNTLKKHYGVCSFKNAAPVLRNSLYHQHWKPAHPRCSPSSEHFVPKF